MKNLNGFNGMEKLMELDRILSVTSEQLAKTRVKYDRGVLEKRINTIENSFIETKHRMEQTELDKIHMIENSISGVSNCYQAMLKLMSLDYERMNLNKQIDKVKNQNELEGLVNRVSVLDKDFITLKHNLEKTILVNEIIK